jgi:hypothetical protein
VAPRRSRSVDQPSDGAGAPRLNARHRWRMRRQMEGTSLARLTIYFQHAQHKVVAHTDHLADGPHPLSPQHDMWVKTQVGKSRVI